MRWDALNVCYAVSSGSHGVTLTKGIPMENFDHTQTLSDENYAELKDTLGGVIEHTKRIMSDAAMCHLPSLSLSELSDLAREIRRAAAEIQDASREIHRIALRGELAENSREEW